MKRIVIGDPHGRWRSVKKIYDYEQPDEVIILGDYFDSFNISDLPYSILVSVEIFKSDSPPLGYLITTGL